MDGLIGEGKGDVESIRSQIEDQINRERKAISKNAAFLMSEPVIPNSVEALMALDDDRTFVRYAYITVLGRHADLSGLEGFLLALQNGEATRDDVLMDMNGSEEGRKRDVLLLGFDRYIKKAAINRKVVKIFPKWRAINRAYLVFKKICSLATQVESRMRQQDVKLAKLENLSLDILDYTSSLKRQFAKKSLNATNDTGGITAATKDFCHDALERSLADEQSLSDFMDEFFMDLSERFRGSEVEILRRNRVYEPILREIVGRNSDVPVLDIACGRGEMLHIVNDLGFKAIGLDLNMRLIEYCRSKCLSVCRSDALSYIKVQESNSLAAITTTHFVEHLELSYLVQTLREAYRVLRPGGGIIVETPNPSNLIVSTIQFYMDPTHRNPIPAVLMQLLLEKIGFVVSPIDLNSRGLDASLGGVDHPQLNHILNSPQDYALLGVKPA